MNVIWRWTSVCCYALAILGFATATKVEAAAFAVAAQSASAGGNANAGVTASAEDASTAWWNPAGMANINSPQAVQVIQIDHPTINFNNNGSQSALGQPLGGDGGNAGHLAFIPQLYVVWPLDDFAFGLTLNVPFGLKTQYDDDWMGRFQAIKSEVRTVSLNPAISYKATKDLWLGAGFDIQYFSAQLMNAVNYSAAVAQGAAAAGLTPAQIAALLNPANPNTIAALQGTADVSGNDTAIGWNVGGIYHLSNARIGVQYRSSLKYHISGDATFNQPTTSSPLAAQVITVASSPGGPLANTPVSVDIKLPQSASIGVFWQVDPKWEMLFDALWTGWSSIPEVRFVRPDGSLFNRIVYNWRNTWRFATGANYIYSQQWKFRAGLAWDQTVVRDDVYREPRLPDSDRFWVTTGAQYRPTDKCLLAEKCWLDFSLSYVQPKDAALVNRNNGNTNAFGLLNGNYSSKVFIIGLQATAAF